MEMNLDAWWVVARGQVSELSDVMKRVQALKSPTSFDFGEIQYRVGCIQTALAEINPQADT